MKLVFSLLALNCLAQQLTPIQSPADGFLLGPISSNYTLDIFYDHLCIDSKNAFPGLFQYWQANSNWLGLNIHILPLPYHPFSFVVAQAGRYIQQSYPTQFINFLSYWFTYQSYVLINFRYWDFPTAQQQIANLTNQATSVPVNEILSALNDDDVYASSQASYEYAASRTITGTPLYLVNDIFVPGATDFESASDWAGFFNSLNN
jgi:hypothetical protein